MAEKLEIAIYKINGDCKQLNNSNDQMADLEKAILQKKYKNQILQDIDYPGLEIKLFHMKSPTNPLWKSFLSDIVEAEQPVLKARQGFNEGFVMIIRKEASQNLYVITGGNSGYHAISEFVDDNFGVDILSRLINSKDKVIRAVRERSVTGGILGTTKYFRNNYNLYENEGFGKIYQELKTDINKKILTTRFGFSEEDLKKDSTCIAKASFKINKQICFDQLIGIINGCEYVLENPDDLPELKPMSINCVTKVNKKQYPELIDKLNENLDQLLWERFQLLEDSENYGLCHKQYEDYLTADKYIVFKNNKNFFGNLEFTDSTKLDNIDILFNQIKQKGLRISNLDDFKELINKLRIKSFNSEDASHPKTENPLLHHVEAETTCNSKTYFFLDGTWYEIQESFINKLNESCQSFMQTHSTTLLDKNWRYTNKEKKEKENDFNAKFIGEEATVVLDKITPDNIEPCDILKWDKANLYLCHIKSGFDNSTRELCSQIVIAASRIKSDLSTSRDYIRDIYKCLENKANSDDDYFAKAYMQIERITEEDFIKLFDKNIVFVIGVLNTTKANKCLGDNISTYKSNIAKASVCELIKSMKAIDFDLKFQQINREEYNTKNLLTEKTNKIPLKSKA